MKLLGRKKVLLRNNLNNLKTFSVWPTAVNNVFIRTRIKAWMQKHQGIKMCLCHREKNYFVPSPGTHSNINLERLVHFRLYLEMLISSAIFHQLIRCLQCLFLSSAHGKETKSFFFSVCLSPSDN